jgi:hypothetical protein
MEAYLAVHPCQEAPYLEVGIAHRQAESQQDLLVAGIQEAYLVEELAYLENLSDFMSSDPLEILIATHTRREAGHARRWLETWRQALWERRPTCRGSVSNA